MLLIKLPNSAGDWDWDVDVDVDVEVKVYMPSR